MAKPVGTIVRLQVQREGLVQGDAYDPAPLLEVEELVLTPSGVAGTSDDGYVLDVHHRDHPRRRGGAGRAISVGFSSHYLRMSERFGDVPLGVAGENVVVEAGRRISSADLVRGLLVVGEEGEVLLAGLRVSRPCRQFTSFLLGEPAALPVGDIREELELLDGGLRGFVASLEHLPGPATIRLGDEVLIP